nr:IS3 family transposase [Companilactobacillus ginsenosidimutans]
MEVSEGNHGWKSILLDHIGVSRQALNKFLHHRKTDWEHKNDLLTEVVLKTYKDHFQRIGAGKILSHITKEHLLDFEVTYYQVRRVMRSEGISCKSKAKKRSRKDDNDQHEKDNVLNQNFEVEKPNMVWLSDSTQLEFGIKETHKVKLSGILDLCSRKIIGSFISPSETAEAEIAMFKETFEEMGDVHPMVHTDRGPAFTAVSFNKLLDEHKVIRSFSRPGTPYDNSPMESWWSNFKGIWMDSHPRPATLEALIKLVQDGIDYFNNIDRLPTKNGLTPEECWNKAIAK